MMFTSHSGLSLCVRCASWLQAFTSRPPHASRNLAAIHLRFSHRSFQTPGQRTVLQSRRYTTTASLSDTAHEVPRASSNPPPPQSSYSTSSSRSDDLEHAARLARNAYGDRLPEDLLSQEELATYKRLYGDPLPWNGEDEEGSELQTKDRHGNWEAISSRLDEGNKFEYDLIEEARAEKEKELEQDEADTTGEEQEGDDLFSMDSDYVRTHPFTLANRFGPSPTTIQISQSAVTQPIAKMLAVTSTTANLVVATQRVFGGIGLPYSPSSPVLSRTLPQRPVALSASQSRMPEIDADTYLVSIYPHAYAAITSALVEVRKRIGSQWLRGLLEKEGGPLILDAGSAGAGALAWREVLKAEWDNMQEKKQQDLSKADTFLEGDLTRHREPMPLGKTTVVVGSDTLRQRAAKLLDSTTFIPRLPDAVPLVKVEGVAPRKQYDVILAPYELWRVEKEFERKKLVETLWSLLTPSGGILILLEKGVPRGFEVIAAAREQILKRHIADPFAAADDGAQQSMEASMQAGLDADGGLRTPARRTDVDSEPIAKEIGMIVAPCTNHAPCPLYQSAGVGKGRKDWCYFRQRFLRPPYLQSALGARRFNHEDVEFSFVAVRRGVDMRLTADNENMLHGDKATDRAFSGYGNERITTRTGDYLNRRSKPHTKVLDNTFFSEAEHSITEENPIEEQAAGVGSPPNSLSLPRLILPPLKRKGHIVLDVCTPSGTFERWLVTRRNGKQAYRDARKAKWGDLWALGAKTREPRRTRAGTVQKNAKGYEKSSRGRRKKEVREILQDAGIID